MNKLLLTLLAIPLLAVAEPEYAVFVIKAPHWASFTNRFQGHISRGIGRGAEWNACGKPAEYRVIADTNKIVFVAPIRVSKLTKGTNAFSLRHLDKLEERFTTAKGRMTVTNDVIGWLTSMGLEPRGTDPK